MLKHIHTYIYAGIRTYIYIYNNKKKNDSSNDNVSIAINIKMHFSVCYNRNQSNTCCVKIPILIHSYST